LGCLLSRDHRKTGLVDLLRVTNPSAAVNSTTPLDFRASGKRFVRFRIGFYANLIKVSQAQATPAGVPELWDALSEAGILEG